MRNRWIVATLAFVLSGIVGTAQEKPAAPQPAEKAPAPAAAPPRESEPLVPLQVTVVLSRHLKDKKISSLPYVLGVLANGPKTNLRMGSDVPIVSSAPGKDVLIAQQAYSYRPVGTNIDCQAFTAAAGVFRLLITVADTSVHLDPAEKAAVPARLTDVPSFRNFNSSFAVLLRDGQTTQYTSATDPVTGEVMRIDLTLNLLK